MCVTSSNRGFVEHNHIKLEEYSDVTSVLMDVN